MFDGFDWTDLALAGSLAAEMAEEEKERLRMELEAEAEEDCCCADDTGPYEPPDEVPILDLHRSDLDPQTLKQEV